MKQLIRFLWKNRAAVIAVAQAAYQYAPKAYDYVKEKTKQLKDKINANRN